MACRARSTFSRISAADLVQTSGLGLWLYVSKIVFQASFKVGDGSEHAAADPLLRQGGEEALDEIEPRSARGREVQEDPPLAFDPSRPFFKGSSGCVRSSAWIWLFSSKLNTAAFSGGSRYRLTTSMSFSSKRGSVLSLNVRTRCGFTSRRSATPGARSCERSPTAGPASATTSASPPPARAASSA